VIIERNLILIEEKGRKSSEWKDKEGGEGMSRVTATVNEVAEASCPTNFFFVSNQP